MRARAVAEALRNVVFGAVSGGFAWAMIALDGEAPSWVGFSAYCVVNWVVIGVGATRR